MTRQRSDTRQTGHQRQLLRVVLLLVAFVALVVVAATGSL
jgi:hypothetical protein